MQAVKLQIPVLYIIYALTMCYVLSQTTDTGTRICKSIDSRNSPRNLESLRGCRVVEGYVSIVLIDKANNSDYEGYSFPELREITQYLLMYRVTGLKSLGQLFPNLAVIRGDSVFFDYSLIIYEVFDLDLVGLNSLTDIVRGGVRIEKNDRLCYVKTIDWNRIAKWDPLKNYVEHNKEPNDCPICTNTTCKESLCWSKTDCQIQSKKMENCHPLCVGGCSGPTSRDCYSCRKFLTLDEDCVSTCPNGTYQFLNRRCITAEQCYEVVVQPSAQSYPSHVISKDEKVEKVLNYVTFNGTCIEICPSGYEFTVDQRGCQLCHKGKCRKVCDGSNIENIAAAQTLRGCTYIEGSLEISIKNGKHKIISEELEDSLGSIEEIKGYLKIVRSFPLVNINFLKNLTKIHGEWPLESNKYSLFILDNQNLQELWDWNTKKHLEILKGRIFFHYNPKLCLSHIDKLVSIIHHTNITKLEVAPESNGDKFACNATSIDIHVRSKSAIAVLFEIPPPKYKNNRPPALLRYVLYYVKASDRNVTIFDETDECGDNGWQTKDISLSDAESHLELPHQNKTVRMLITNLEPNTQYAFYVKTYTVDSIGGQSTIQYVVTLPSQPSALMSLQGNSNSPSEIFVRWEPPKRPNGKLTEYVVSGFRHEEDKVFIDRRNYCVKPMDHVLIETTTNPPNIMTHVQSEAKTCCAENKISYTPKDGFERLCDQSGKYKIPFGYLDQDSTSFCEKYFYSYIYTNPLNRNDKQFDECSEEIFDNKIVPKRDDKAELKSLMEESSRMVVKNETVDKDGTYNTFVRRLNASTESITFNNLRHFSTYTIEVKVCREKHPEEVQSNPSCSVTDFITIRTQRKYIADAITSEIKVETNNQTILLSWDEPKSPNGVIVAYNVELKRTDVENAIPNTECLTRLQYEVNGHSWSINGLIPGKYNLRLRAISLAGEGPFTEYIKFNIKETRSGLFRMFLGIFILLLVLILFSAAGFYVFYWRKRISMKNFRLVASVNPEYTSVVQYVEDEWELSRDDVELIKELGQGTFGMVYEGFLRSSLTKCAVKTVNEAATQNDTNLFLNEASVMKCTTNMHHIVRLLGVVSRGNPPLVVMELMTRGDLKSYLRMTRESYEHLPPSKGVVLNMAAQIADGMAYLETRKFVHRDLAARNCMVADDLTVKIGDFGMTRDIYETDYYRKGNKGLLPIRWMAPESLNDGVFTSQSDVWSYGVVLWEIGTLAEQPYQGSSNDQVLHDVIAGRKLETPVFCPKILKSIMKTCWNRRPQQRPTFLQILSQLEQFVDGKFKEVSFYHSDAAEELRKALSDYVEMKSNVDDGPVLNNLHNSNGTEVHYIVDQSLNESDEASVEEPNNSGKHFVSIVT